MSHIYALRQAVDLIIDAQAKRIEPSLGAAIAILNRTIDKMHCPACRGAGYIRELNSLDNGSYTQKWTEDVPCPACQERTVEEAQELPL